MAMDLGGIESGRLWRLKRREYDRLVLAGAFSGKRLELLRGLLVRMSPQEPPHAAAMTRIHRLLLDAFGRRVVVRAQLPLALSDESEPEPDFAIVAARNYERTHPTTALLVIEVADSSLRFDQSVKAALYAEASIPEYWLVDLRGKTLRVFDHPRAGRYERVRSYERDESIRPAALPRVWIAVKDLIAEKRR